MARRLGGEEASLPEKRQVCSTRLESVRSAQKGQEEAIYKSPGRHQEGRRGWQEAGRTGVGGELPQLAMRVS